jgi:hypothetical protein
MLSHNNILHYHSSRLPDKIIIMANVSQIVNNLNDAMGKSKETEISKPYFHQRKPVENGYFFQFQYKTVFIAA